MLPRRELPMGISWPGGSTEVFPWVFNIADVELLAGMALLLIHVQLADRRERLASTATPDSDSNESTPADAERTEADQSSGDVSA
jgi:hypothetical protein